jgi:DNA-binding beta-propeller fold protein YncE
MQSPFSRGGAGGARRDTATPSRPIGAGRIRGPWRAAAGIGLAVPLAALALVFVPASQRRASASLAAAVAPTYLTSVGGGSSGHAGMYPAGLDVDANGNIYVADIGNDQVVAYDSTGRQLWRRGTRTGGSPGLGQFVHPSDVAFEGGQVFVADSGNGRIQVLNASNGAPVSIWAATFSSLSGISAGVDASSNPVLLVTDSGANLVQVFMPNGAPAAVSTVGAGGGSGPGQMSQPRDAATDSAGNIYVADAGNNRIDRFSPAGAVVTPAWAGTSPAAQLVRPIGIKVDSTGNVYVADGLNNKIEVLSPTGSVTTTFGAVGTGNGQFSGIRGVALSAGATPTVYASDVTGYRIEQFTNSGTFTKMFTGAKPAAGKFNEPMGMVATSGGLYVADSANQRIDAFSGVGSGATPQGSWPSGGFGNGGGGLAWPRAVAYSSTGSTLWIADTYNQRLAEYSTSGKATGRALGGAGTSLGKMLLPSGVVTYQGNVAVADTLNNRVQMLNPATKTLVWSYAGLKQPRGLAIFGTTIYVADTGDHQIVKINASTGSLAGLFGAGQLQTPVGVAPMSDGSVWVSDMTTNQLVQFSNRGSLLQTYGALGTGAGQFNAPAGLGVVPGSSPILLVADSLNDRVQEFAITTGTAPNPPVYDHDIGTTATASITPTGVVRDSNGNWYVDDAGSFDIQVWSPDGSTLLHTIFTTGVKGLDNTHIAQSRGLGIDPNTNELWVADTVNNRVLKLATDLSTIEVNTFVKDNPNGPLNAPVGIAVDNSGNAYICDTDNRIIEISPTGQYIRQWGGAGGISTKGKFNTPAAITFSSVGGDAVYVNDANNFRVQKFTLTGQWLATYGSQGTGNGQFTKDARGIAVDQNGVIYAADIGGNRIVRWAANGTALSSLGAGLPYYRPGPKGSPCGTCFFYGARGLFVSGQTLAVADLFNYRILFWSLNGTYQSEIQGTYPPTNGHNLPHGVTLDAAGNIYISDYWNQWIQKFAPNGTLLANWGLGRGSDPGSLNFPGGIRVDPNGKYLFIANRESNVIDRWNLSDGSFSARFALPSGPLSKPFPRDVAVDPTTESIAAADEKNNKVDVLSSSGSVLQTIDHYGPGAGTPMGPPQSVAYDSQGNLYVADGNPVGNIYLVHVYSSLGAWSQDITVTDQPSGLFVSGNFVWVVSSADSNVGVYTTSGGMVVKFGSYGLGDSQFNNPYVGIAVDKAGNVYIADTFNHRVKVFRPGP